MTKQRVKYMMKSRYKKQLLQFLICLEQGDIQNYDIQPLQGNSGLYRVRIGQCRVLLNKEDGLYHVVKIQERGNIY